MKLWLTGVRYIDESPKDVIPWEVCGIFSTKTKAIKAAVAELSIATSKVKHDRRIAFIGPLSIDKEMIGNIGIWPGAFNIGERRWRFGHDGCTGIDGTLLIYGEGGKA